MSRSFVVALLLGVVHVLSQCPSEVPISTRIVGGTSAGAREFSFLVSIQTQWGQHYCGGTLVSPNWVVSAAHCPVEAGSHVIQIGKHYNDGRSDSCVEQFRVKRVISHAAHDKNNNNDINLIELEGTSKYEPAHLYGFPSQDLNADLEQSGRMMDIAGWGSLYQGGTAASQLMKAQVPIGEKAICSAQYNANIPPWMICAGYSRGGIDTCQGDSGGPLFTLYGGEYYLIGVTSFGKGCALPNYFGVYTRVSQYLDWICSNTNGDVGCTPIATAPTPPRSPTFMPTKTPTPQPTPFPTVDPNAGCSVTLVRTPAGQAPIYDGYVSFTVSGTRCQRWSSTTPHTGLWLQNVDHNFCRNPDRGVDGPWCYTSDPAVRWEYCDVGTRENPICHDAPAPTPPTSEPTLPPTNRPTPDPTNFPTKDPTPQPTPQPTFDPTAQPTPDPTFEPTAQPTPQPTDQPTHFPTAEPTSQPTDEPTNFPTVEPTNFPTVEPTQEPTTFPTTFPTPSPSLSSTPVTAEPTAMPTPFPTTSSTPQPSTSGEDRGFDWGDCGGGEGSFTASLTRPGETQVLGTIPFGKNGIRVELSAVNDLDIVLYDPTVKTGSTFGMPLVLWCNMPCERGLLDGSTVQSVDYRGMKITYSGYNGVNQQRGREYIEIEGTVPSDLSIGVNAYRPGVASVEYSWLRTDTDCCMGKGPCGGTFHQDIAENAIVDIGEIPVGKVDLYIELKAENDLDIQLYDLEETEQWRDGKAIIAYCKLSQVVTGTCNQGLLGNNQGFNSATYKNLTYEYSGYNGFNGSKGNEYIQIRGTTNTKLSMKAYGYRAGQATVSYTYYEPQPAVISATERLGAGQR